MYAGPVAERVVGQVQARDCLGLVAQQRVHAGNGGGGEAHIHLHVDHTCVRVVRMDHMSVHVDEMHVSMSGCMSNCVYAPGIHVCMHTVADITHCFWHVFF